MTVTEDPIPSLDPSALLAGELTPTKLDQFRAAVFQSVDTLEQLRNWLSSPMAKGSAGATRCLTASVWRWSAARISSQVSPRWMFVQYARWRPWRNFMGRRVKRRDAGRRKPGFREHVREVSAKHAKHARKA